MKNKDNWKYKGFNINLLNANNSDTKESQEILQSINIAKKKEIKEVFENGLENNYDRYKKYLFEKNLFLFSDLEYHIKESVNCLIIGAFIASITNTNLILERAIKLALIQFDAGGLSDYSDDEIIKKYIEADRKYSGKNIDSNIQKCVKYKILNEDEATELKTYKLKFRDGFSHFTPKNILKGENSLMDIDLNPKIGQHLKMPMFQASEVIQFAINNADKHLNYVLEIINHLQYKVLEKFRENKKNS